MEVKENGGSVTVSDSQFARLSSRICRHDPLSETSEVEPDTDYSVKKKKKKQTKQRACYLRL